MEKNKKTIDELLQEIEDLEVIYVEDLEALEEKFGV